MCATNRKIIWLDTVPTGTIMVMLVKIMPLTRISEFSYMQELMMPVYKFDVCVHIFTTDDAGV